MWLMPVLPIIEMTEDDPRWLQMQRDKVEARIRFGKSAQAREERDALLDPTRVRPDWTWQPLPVEPPFEVIPWD
ncbi:MAG: hypothetical protein ABIT76_07820 [Chthoniobacterales bacterium]